MKNSPMIRCSVSPVTAALDLRGAEIPAEVFPAGGHLMALVKVRAYEKRDTDKIKYF